MIPQPLIPKKYVLNAPITALTFEEQIFLILRWARARESRIVCLANVHMLMEAHWHPEFASVLAAADLVSPDGMPLVWMLRKMGKRSQDRVAGMDVFLRLCQLSSQSGVSPFFLGSQSEVLERMRKKLEREFPNLKIAGMEPLPFRPLSPTEDQALIEKINASGAGLVLVCLGCPKQEYWMLQHLDKIQAVMIGVGAVFPLYAGIHQRAPRLVRDTGLEWLYRLIQEPNRLWYRYSHTIPPFIWLASQQLLAQPKRLPASNPIKNCFSPSKSANVIDSGQELPIVNLESSKIGEILVRQNLISETALSAVLEEQLGRSEKKIGELLVERGYITQAELEYHLRNQRIKLGELLVQRQVISQAKLNKLLNWQKSTFTSKKLGEILLQQKLLCADELSQVLVEQYWRRTGLWLMTNKVDDRYSWQLESLHVSN